jgi:hypothetical protein
MLIVAIMTLYEVVNYEHCFDYDLAFIFNFSSEAVALFGADVSFSVFLFYEFSCVSMFSFR